MDAQATPGIPGDTSDREQLRCSSSSVDEPLPGTASHQRRWVLLEHPGAWSPDILGGSVFGEALTERLREHLAAADARLLLIRRPGRGGQNVPRRHVYLADTAPGSESLLVLEVEHPADLLEIDLHTGARNDGAAGVLSEPREVTAPLGLVCTHGKRDQCCALRGRPVAATLEGRLGAELACADPAAGIWECSHTGGHRFAPVLLVMPTGLTYGSEDTEAYTAAMRAAMGKRISLSGYRGRSSQPPVAQVADIAVRSRIGDVDVASLAADGRVDPTDPARARAHVRHLDGRTWRVDMSWRALPPRPASCGGKPKKAGTWDVEVLEELSGA